MNVSAQVQYQPVKFSAAVMMIVILTRHPIDNPDPGAKIGDYIYAKTRGLGVSRAMARDVGDGIWDLYGTVPDNALAREIKHHFSGFKLGLADIQFFL